MKNLYYKLKMKYLNFKIKRSKKKFIKASNKFTDSEDVLKEQLLNLGKSLEDLNNKIESKQEDNLFYE